MKTLNLLLSFLFYSLSSLALAQSGDLENQLIEAIRSETQCSEFVKYDEQYLFIGQPKTPTFSSPGGMKLISLKDKSQIEIFTEGKILDVVRIDNDLWLLTQTGLEKWSLSRRLRTNRFKTTNLVSKEFEYKEAPTGLALSNNKLFISHGRLGYSIFDLASEKLVHSSRLIPAQAPHESMATSVVKANGKVIFLIDGFTLARPGQRQSFKGFVFLNPLTNQVEKQMVGLDPGADSFATDGQQLLVSFMGLPIWKYNLSDFAGQSLPAPRARVWRYPIPGNPFGKASVTQNFYLTCYSKRKTEPGKRYEAVILALSRTDMGLN